MGVGPIHVAVGMNNRAWFYVVGQDGIWILKSQIQVTINVFLGVRQVSDREYLGTVHSIKLNADYACALFEGKLHLHAVSSLFQIALHSFPQTFFCQIEQARSDDRESRVFPDSDKSSFKITSVALSPDCLVFATDVRKIWIFLLERKIWLFRVATCNTFYWTIGSTSMNTDTWSGSSPFTTNR